MKAHRLTIFCWVCVWSLLSICSCVPVQRDTDVELPPPEKQTEVFSPQSEPEVQYYTHTIRWPGENLIRIARWYTGSGNNWLQIIEANPTIDPKRIRIGDSILIPEDLLKTQEPMPESYRVRGVQQKVKTAEPSFTAETPALPVDDLPGAGEIELFGPVYGDTETNAPGEPVPPLPLETID